MSDRLLGAVLADARELENAAGRFLESQAEFVREPMCVYVIVSLLDPSLSHPKLMLCPVPPSSVNSKLLTV